MDSVEDLMRRWLTASLDAGGTVAGAPVHDVGRAKVVRKPWGEERWLVAEGPFALKLIRINAGCRTSLQFHRRKQEANLVVEGEARLSFATRAGEPLGTTHLLPGHVAHLAAGVVHRIEAVRTTLLLEVSTPELDDVVRIEDDAGRGDGLIASEHDS
ncbi:hypothetical protein [Micromonospora sp. NPDC049282]|uniref:hypothetical protein n=1 Tax=Micromonospora sp. NPDC049282 TaxID=3364269 RepID=UPI00370F9F49